MITNLPAVDVAVAALWWRGHGGKAQILLTRRLADVHLPGLWEFPGGKVEPGEAPAHAAARELEEEVGLAIQVERFEALLVHAHDYGDRVIRLHAFAVPVDRPLPVAHRGVADHRWATVDEAELLSLPAANGAILSALKRHLAP